MAHQWIQGPSEAAEEEDRRLFFKVRNRLWDYEPLRASGAEISVEVQHRIVHVSGRTRTTAQKQLITAFLRRIEGVLGVDNTVVSDLEVIRDVAFALGRDKETAPWTILVDARLGAVVLVGTVPSQSTADRAVEIAQSLGLAHTVESQLVVAPVPALP